MQTRIEILAHEDDGRALKIENLLKSMGKDASVRAVDVYSSESKAAANVDFAQGLANPVTQKVNETPDDFDWALEIGYLPGVTDNVGSTTTELLDLFAGQDAGDHTCYSSRLYLIKGKMSKEDVQELAQRISNKLIQRVSIKSQAQYKKDGGMDVVIPKVMLDNKGAVADEVDLDVSDEELEKLGTFGIENEDGSRRGPLGLQMVYLKAIQDYFKKEGRKPRDIEIETLAQTWSEHCKHTIFASPIDEVKDGLYRHYIKRATMEIRESRGDDDICVSVFSDNAGGIIFDENYLITDKVETHNSPSALDPFGGAITGIVGVNRDCMGFGKGAKPVINRYGFCLADPRKTPNYFRDKDCTDSLLPPSTIMNGVVAGVESGGNCSGIPTPAGFVYFDDRFAGKPLVFVGTVGLIPREINGKPAHEKKARPGDKIVMAGGRVGADGIHGATFSSVALDEGSPATAVQIGDPITQKKMSDAVIKEIREKDWYNAITDNGAGGLSSSVGEMGEGAGGFHLELEKVPLKYPGLSPWQIWISESQERMTFAVPPENTDKLIAFLAKRGVEATVIGTYTNSGRAHISWHGETIMDISMDFLHDGNPETPLKTTFTRGGEKEPGLAEPDSYEETLLTMMGRLNVCSKEFIATQYDHNVQGSAVLGPIQGKGRVYAEASITRPVLNSPKGVVLSQGLFPRYSDIDTAAMAAAGVDMAVRNAVAAGVDFNHLALLDNFCWCSSDEPERLGQLKRAVETIYNVAVKYGTPFISGKDSMFNDFKGYDEKGNPIKVSAPPTLLASSIGVIPHVERAISIAPKATGDLVYLLGATKDELGASEYYDELGHLGNNVPETDTHENLRLYKLYSRASRDRLIASAMAVGYGGLGVTLAKKAIAGQFGLDIDLSAFDLLADRMLFSESTGRIVVTVAPKNKKAFERNFKGYEQCHYIGSVAHSDNLFIRDVLKVPVKDLEEAYKAPLKDY
ncbi:MAG: phosphoribosylformylglycinamidine synthase [Alphaproteobacteria bacterium]|nr:phosphoribosylformylglycinamidine synthase [Alphaproteobacteria bacterium]